MVDAYLDLLEMDYFELGEAFKGLADENVWKRPAEGLLSIGEIAGHIAYWEAIRLAGEGEDMAKCKVRSPLIDRRFRYYQTTLANPSADDRPAMTAEQVYDELKRVHEEAVKCFKELSPDLSESVPGLPGFSYRESLKYLVFHIAYHTGQMYTVRHLLGEEPPDN